MVALLLVRAENNKKLLNCLADLERHGKLKIKGQPRIIKPSNADAAVAEIMNQKPRSITNSSVLIKVEQDTTRSIMNIRKIHPPGHLMVISEEYPIYKKLNSDFLGLTPFKGYHSHK
jgi:hypothetical protein